MKEQILPQLVRGGKYVFGWSRIREDGSIAVPPEAIAEYGLRTDMNVILISCSRTSGGFIIAQETLIKQSRLSAVLVGGRDLEAKLEQGRTIRSGRRYCCRVKVLDNNLIVIDPETLRVYGLKSGDRLLSVRGSYLGIGMALRGPIVEYAGKHPEIFTWGSVFVIQKSAVKSEW
jgi:hypothetical protein